MKFNVFVILLISLLSISNVIGQVKSSYYFIAGMPDPNFYPENNSEIFISELLELRDGKLHVENIISDSTEALRVLRHYPQYKRIFAFLGEKEYVNQPFAENSFQLLELNTETLELNKRIIPKSISIHGYDYALLESSMKVIAINNNAVATFEYILPVEAKDNVPLTLYYYFSDRLVNSNVSHYNKIIPNGSVAGPFFGANSDQMLLHGKPDTKELLIPSFIEEDSTFFLDLPEDVILTDKYSAQVKINNDRILLMNFYNQNNSNPNYYLYNKHLSIWGKFPQNESYTNIINYGDWLAGASNIEIGQRPYEGKQVGEDRWIESDSKYGYSIRKYMNRKMPRTKLSGFLFIRNILDLTTVLYWNTGQSDSEILLIDSNLVYYRKHDEIWEVPIINNHELGKHRLLIKHPDVTSIHFMFLK